MYCPPDPVMTNRLSCPDLTDFDRPRNVNTQSVKAVMILLPSQSSFRLSPTVQANTCLYVCTIQVVGLCTSSCWHTVQARVSARCLYALVEYTLSCVQLWPVLLRWQLTALVKSRSKYSRLFQNVPPDWRCLWKVCRRKGYGCSTSHENTHRERGLLT